MQPCATGEVESVLVVRAGIGVQRIAPVASQVFELEGGDDQAEKRLVRNDDADRVQPGSAVGPDGSEEGKADADLTEEVPSCLSEVGPFARELTPGQHPSAVGW